MEIIGYKDDTLTVRLPNGRVCTHFDVPESIHRELIASEVPLDYFNRHLWNSRFEHALEWEGLEALLEEIAGILLVEPPIAVNERSVEDTPLHVAAVWGDVTAVQMLIDAGAHLNTPGDMGCTPLYNAVVFGRVRCARCLIAAGASLDDVNELGTSAREKALASGNDELMHLFQGHGVQGRCGHPLKGDT